MWNTGWFNLVTSGGFIQMTRGEHSWHKGVTSRQCSAWRGHMPKGLTTAVIEGRDGKSSRSPKITPLIRYQNCYRANHCQLTNQSIAWLLKLRFTQWNCPKLTLNAFVHQILFFFLSAIFFFIPSSDKKKKKEKSCAQKPCALSLIG